MDGPVRPGPRPTTSRPGLTTQELPLRDLKITVDTPDSEVRRSVTSATGHDPRTESPRSGSVPSVN